MLGVATEVEDDAVARPQDSLPPAHTLNLRKISHKETLQAAAAARRSCCFASWPDYDSGKLGQFFTSDAVSALRAMQVSGTAGCSTQ